MKRKDWDHEYSSRSPLFGVEQTMVVAEALAMLSVPSQALDLGCGDGRDTLHLLRAGHRVDAVDFSSAGVSALVTAARSKGLVDLLTASVADIRTYTPEIHNYDLIVGITILDHLPSECHDQIIDRAIKALRPGGLIALEMYSDRDPSRATTSRGASSEFSGAIRSYAPRNYLLNKLPSELRVLRYSDRLEQDSDHGPVHWHGFQTILAKLEEYS
jgi:cyclopropane fatty-acyl-phospholipid synthase-like methyltransferase